MDMIDPTESTSQYTGELPPREELWLVVQEAHDYLKAYITDPSARVDPIYGKIVFNTSTWGEVVTENGEPIKCEVCLAGLWYLRKGFGLLGGRGIKPAVPDFLDDLRSPECMDYRIEQHLGVPIPYDLEDDLVGEGLWEAHNPSHILLFLGWLLEQKNTEA